jgi:hypothetical protein
MIRIHQAHAPYPDDDAYYYIIIAKNIALTGLSTFDNQTLTNGYHPLWLRVLVAQYLTLGSSVYVTISIELALSTAGFWLFLTSFRNASALFQVTFALLFAWITTPLIGKGMEVSLLILGMGLFTHLVVEPCETNGASVRLGIAAVLCIGARLDSALFVIPTLLLHLGSVRRSLVALTPVVIAGAIYAAGNFWIFGMPFPISGAVKSLGGLQLNHRFIDQVTSYGHGPGALKAAHKLPEILHWTCRSLFPAVEPWVFRGGTKLEIPSALRWVYHWLPALFVQDPVLLVLGGVGMVRIPGCARAGYVFPRDRRLRRQDDVQLQSETQERGDIARRADRRPFGCSNGAQTRPKLRRDQPRSRREIRSDF